MHQGNKENSIDHKYHMDLQLNFKKIILHISKHTQIIFQGLSCDETLLEQFEVIKQIIKDHTLKTFFFHLEKFFRYRLVTYFQSNRLHHIHIAIDLNLLSR
jgi:hypothetical protein